MPLQASLALVAVVISLDSVAGRQAEPAAGKVTSNVAAKADPAQTYALYLPAQYQPDRTWPLLLAFHPAARGRLLVDLYRDVAEDYGYIVAASNVSKNGPWEPSLAAAEAMVNDVTSRWSVDAKRMYATGFSGGARVATQIALQSGLFSGVIVSGAGFPDSQPRRTVDFDLAGTIGAADFNLGEVQALDRALASPHRIFYFDGGHTLPPPRVARLALEWLEARAMMRGLRPKDAAVIDRWLTARVRDAESRPRREQADALQAVIDDFRELTDVSAVEQKLKALRR